MADIQDLKEGNFKEKIAKGVVLCGFWAPWCHTCHTVMPLFDKIAPGLEDRVQFYKINVVENPGLSSKYGVMSLPNILIFRDGKVTDQIIGSTSQKIIENKIKKVLK